MSIVCLCEQRRTTRAKGCACPGQGRALPPSLSAPLAYCLLLQLLEGEGSCGWWSEPQTPCEVVAVVSLGTKVRTGIPGRDTI